MINKDKKIFVAGANGLVGSALVRNLHSKGYYNLLTPSHKELDLKDQKAVAAFMDRERPAYVLLAAAKVGGIMANNILRADFIYENIMIQSNVIHEAWRCGVEKLLFLGSTCIYPKNAPQPMAETALLTSELEYTNEPYAVAKIAGMKMCESYNLQYSTNFISVMPTNLYGYNDNFDFKSSHVLPAMMRKFYLAHLLETGNKTAIKADFNRRGVVGVDSDNIEDITRFLTSEGVTQDLSGRVSLNVWGSGTPLREFLWSDDMADACIFLMENVDWTDLTNGASQVRNTHINIGTGVEIAIGELARTIASAVGFKGDICFDTTKPDGTMRKLTDPSKLHALGWRHSIELEHGIKKLLDWYIG